MEREEKVIMIIIVLIKKNLAEDLNSGLPRTNPASGQIGT